MTHIQLLHGVSLSAMKGTWLYSEGMREEMEAPTIRYRRRARGTPSLASGGERDGQAEASAGELIVEGQGHASDEARARVGRRRPPSPGDDGEGQPRAKRARACAFNDSQKDWIAAKCKGALPPHQHWLPPGQAPPPRAVRDIVASGVAGGILPEETTVEEALQVARHWRPALEVVQVVARQVSASTMSEDAELVEEYPSSVVDVNIYTTVGDVIRQVLASLNVPPLPLSDLTLLSVAGGGDKVVAKRVSPDAWASAHRELLAHRAI